MDYAGRAFFVRGRGHEMKFTIRDLLWLTVLVAALATEEARLYRFTSRWNELKTREAQVSSREEAVGTREALVDKMFGGPVPLNETR